MNGAKDIRSYGYKVGSIPCGKANLITDVPGVKVRALYGGRKWS